jgi:ABC-type nitrate/sulfonate/bicarbonate transport system permease component
LELNRHAILSIIYPIAALILVIGVWAGLVELFQIPRYVLPAPTQVL